MNTENTALTKENTVIFIHIPRTAGVSLDAILERQYNLAKIYSLYSQEKLDEFNKLSENKKANIHLLNGHFMSYGIHERLPNPSTYITMMREPVDRVISHYYFVRRSPNHYLHETVMGKNMSLQDYVGSELSIEINNGQTRLLAGLKENPGIGIGKGFPEMLNRAKTNIEENFAVVGLTEEFDKSLILFKKALGWSETFYLKRNETKNRKAVKEVPDNIIQTIREYNEMDIELYNYAKNRLHESIETWQTEFEKELEIFQKNNEKYGKLYTNFWLGVSKIRKLFLTPQY
ncbi:sulfotransferase family 2 domain-containing protein [Oscillatoria sp. HE19RPO]|uniref:sulfotransferase family 2 domain-containing protein n=1 Tax=Oscillatoria sp. HE19RPO TaxID=2954806 RepID=UPI0020C2167F|nr:sulfotransferase family 2 domain-containing protein [Oscillatoria sp. HE19RPO]